MNELAVIEGRQLLSAADIRSQVNLVQEVMRGVMKEGTHYGTIPGTPKPSLWKPGAEVLCSTFRIAVSYNVEDLSDGDAIRYRVTAVGTHQTSGIVMGSGLGEASSDEEKYKWRKAVCDEEFDATPENRKRVKYGKSRGDGFYKVQQVRTEPADIANTVLKMAAKRAQVAMTLNVTAASDIFTQDIEDLPEGMQPEGEDGAPPAARTVSQPRPKGGNGNGHADEGDTHAASDGQVAWLKGKLNGDEGGPTQAECLKFLKRDKLEGLTVADWKRAKEWINNPSTAAA